MHESKINMKLPISVIKPIKNFVCILTTTQCKRRCLITTNASRIYLIGSLFNVQFKGQLVTKF